MPTETNMTNYEFASARLDAAKKALAGAVDKGRAVTSGAMKKAKEGAGRLSDAAAVETDRLIGQKYRSMRDRAMAKGPMTKRQAEALEKEGRKTMRNRLIAGGGVAGTGYAATRKREMSSAARITELSVTLDNVLGNTEFNAMVMVPKSLKDRILEGAGNLMRQTGSRASKAVSRISGGPEMVKGAKKFVKSASGSKYRKVRDVVRDSGVATENQAATMKTLGNQTVRDRATAGIGALGLGGLAYGATRKKDKKDNEYSVDYSDLSDTFEFCASSGKVDARLIELNAIIDAAIAGDSLGEL